ncbi:MAG: protein NosL [Myxococcaceae bacterium]|nr:protein NosL [Myxococcaceae bacterium]
MGEPRGESSRRLLPLLLGAAVVAAALGFFWELRAAQRLPEGPVPVVWDKEACASCKMHIGQPEFAAQLQLADGQVLDFDDPGCLFTWLSEHEDPVHAIWFHHHHEERWLSQDDVGFVTVAPTPMGYGLGAVDRSTPGAKSFEQVREEFRRNRGGREGAGQ